MNLIEKQKEAIFEGLHCRSSSKDKKKGKLCLREEKSGLARGVRLAVNRDISIA